MQQVCNRCETPEHCTEESVQLALLLALLLWDPLHWTLCAGCCNARDPVMRACVMVWSGCFK